jgi:drug/metabolite transporter (DMT)-like permease
MTAVKKTDVLLFLLLASFWGGSFVAIKFVLEALPPIAGAAMRVAGALAILTAIFKASGCRLTVSPELRRRMWVAGFFAQAAPFCLLFWGERRVSAGLAGIINGTVPLWTFLLGLATGLESRASLEKSIGLILSFAGLACVFGPLVAFSGSPAERAGAMAIMLMAISYAIGILINRSLLAGDAKVDFRANLFHQHCASLAFLVLASAVLEPRPSLSALAVSWRAPMAILYLSLFSTALAWLIFYHLIREWGAVSASMATYIAPIFALLWDFLFFGNVPRASELVGIAAIIGGIILIQQPFAALQKRR